MRPRLRDLLLSLPAVLTVLSLCAQPLNAQNTAAVEDAAAEAAPASTELEELVGRIALYPDDLLSIVLPAATFPLDIVEADRWIQQNKGNAEAQPKESWDDSVKALINYPDVVSMMSNDLDWTAAMGEAVAADQTAVMDAVQAFRRKAEGAGNLKTDDKQVVTVEEEVVKIVQADPQVIYVPQYEPEVVVVQQTVPVYPTYYPTPYPVYYYPYPPGYSFAAGFFWGATVAYAFDWWGGGIHNDIYVDIDRGDINIDRGDINVDRGDRGDLGDRGEVGNRPTDISRERSQQLSAEGRGSWQSQQRPSDVRQGRTQPSTRQTGAGAAGNRASTANRAAPSQGQLGGAGVSSRQSGGATGLDRGPSASASTRYNNTSRNASSARSSPPSRDAFSGMSSGRSVNAQSYRGASSRSAGGFSGGSRGGFGGGGGRRR